MGKNILRANFQLHVYFHYDQNCLITEITGTVNSAKHPHLPVQKYSFEILQIQKYLILQFQTPGHWGKKKILQIIRIQASK